jgi:phage shock protein A
MSYFSRLSDIISCNLSALLADAPNRAAAVAKLIAEIEEGLAGAKRSVTAAAHSEQRLRTDLETHQSEIGIWKDKAREELVAGRDDSARHALLRKRELEDLVGGLEQQLAAATSTREHLATMLRAIEARLAEARRIEQQIQRPEAAAAGSSAPEMPKDSSSTRNSVDRTRLREVEDELEALRREVKQGE